MTIISEQMSRKIKFSDVSFWFFEKSRFLIGDAAAVVEFRPPVEGALRVDFTIGVLSSNNREGLPEFSVNSLFQAWVKSNKKYSSFTL